MGDRGIEFETKVFSGVPRVAEILALPPPARRSLLEEGVPEYFFYRKYAADADLSIIRLEGRSPLVRFGSDFNGVIGVDLASGNVVYVDGRRTVSFVNATVGNFTETIRMLIDNFPFGASIEDFEEAETAANGMRAIIRSVDVQSMAPGSYWPGFADEVDGWLYSLAEFWNGIKPDRHPRPRLVRRLQGGVGATKRPRGRQP